MEEFQIHISLEGLPQEIRVIPEHDEQHNTSYKLFNEAHYLGTVWPECVDEGVCWFSSDELPEDSVIKIGEAIEQAEQ